MPDDDQLIGSGVGGRRRILADGHERGRTGQCVLIGHDQAHDSHVIVALQNGDLATARQQLAQAISRTDGCALRGTPDGNGPGRDWITTCAVQGQVYPLLIDALAAITP